MTDSLELASKIVEHGAHNFDWADMFPRGVATIAEGQVIVNAMYSEDPLKSFFSS
jgi:hypothetical protein